MHSPQTEMAPDPDLAGDQKSSEKARTKFRMDVQISVMRIMGYLRPEVENIADENKKMYEINDIFEKWINDGKAAEFAKCYSDLVPAGANRRKDEVESVAEMVAVEMGAQTKH